ncbi:MAG: efflux RND transporter periplasmic adaptor subunit [Nitrococcus sp.]|nr:efflux RND transporter periplasmic adaptor subunit [Nitrococcus sp.]
MNTSIKRWIAAALCVAVLALPLALGGCMESGETTGKASVQAAGREHASKSGQIGASDHGEQGHTEKEMLVNLTPAQIMELGIELRTAQSGTVKLGRSLPGEVTLNPNRLAHVIPRVPGVVSEVRVIVGDRVKEGEVMAVLISRELAQAKSAYLATLTRLDLAKANFQRAEDLWRQQITAEADYLVARQALEEARVTAQLAERELYTLGVAQDTVANLPEQPAQNLARYALTAPIGGEVIRRHAIEGEVLHEDPAEPPFVVADLSNVWVQLTVYPKDLAAVRPGQKVMITAGQGLQATGTIAYVSPVVGEATRTAKARVVLKNPEGRWKPGLFVTGHVRTDDLWAEVVVPKSALQTVDGQSVVFVQTPEGFKPQPVEVGRSNAKLAQIVSGLKPGQSYVAANGFILKAEMLKSTFGGHGH